MLRPYKKTDKVQLDDQTRRMLGVTNDEQIQVMEGQTADKNRLRTAQEKALLLEACTFGDALIEYTVGHVSLSFEQRVWALALGIFNVRFDYPEGTDKFDDLVDQGGDDLHLDKTSEVTDEAAIDAIQQGLSPLKGDDLVEAAKFAETFAKYVTMKKHQIRLSNPQAAYGLGRAFHNLRLGFPLEEGGTVAFDEYARQAGEYFDRNR